MTLTNRWGLAQSPRDTQNDEDDHEEAGAAGLSIELHHKITASTNHLGDVQIFKKFHRLHAFLELEPKCGYKLFNTSAASSETTSMFASRLLF
ncbi:hypothetical protein AAHH79_33265, partial [Burkholderia pseudomallei]